MPIEADVWPARGPSLYIGITDGIVVSGYPYDENQTQRMVCANTTATAPNYLIAYPDIYDPLLGTEYNETSSHSDFDWFHPRSKVTRNVLPKEDFMCGMILKIGHGTDCGYHMTTQIRSAVEGVAIGFRFGM